MTKTEDITGPIDISSSEFNNPPKTVADGILERLSGNGKSGGGKIHFTHVNEN